MSKAQKTLIWLYVLIGLALIAAALSLTLYSVLKQPQLVQSNSQISMLFDDEFNGNSLNNSKWNTCYEWYNTQYKGCSNYGNNESEWYKSSQVTESNGDLVLTAQRQDIIGGDEKGNAHTYSYVSGMVTTNRKTYADKPLWQGGYGTYAARIKVPSGQAVWPAFWLLPTDRKWPPEIDIMELLGNKPNQTLHTYFWPTVNGPAKDVTSYTAPYNFSDGWHVYAVDWQPHEIRWLIDGKEVKRATGVNIPSTDMQIILNLAVGGNLPGSPDSTTPDTLQMLVDYVRVYKN